MCFISCICRLPYETGLNAKCTLLIPTDAVPARTVTVSLRSEYSALMSSQRRHKSKVCQQNASGFHMSLLKEIKPLKLN
jgi:hypothetical protein